MTSVDFGFSNGQVETVSRWLDQSVRIVALTGAGISTESGIPDFRGPQGLWTTNPKAERLSDIHYYMSDPDVRRLSWQSRLDHPAWKAAPNDGHRALAHLERRGKLLAIVTQNIDGLHQQAGHAPDKVIEVHGTMRDVMCMACRWRGPMGPVLDRVRAGEDDPACEHCGGILKSATISFGQSLVEDDLIRADAAARSCDLLLAVGTTLGVYPAAAVVPLAKQHGARIVILNGAPTEMDGLADVVIRGSISEVLPVLVGMLTR